MSESTIMLLEMTLVKELSNKTLDKITVKDLCKQINITRQAFYYHFQDIYSLLESIYTKKALETIGKNKTYDSWIKGYKNVFDTMLLYKDFIINTYKSLSKDYLEKYLYDVTFDLLFSVIDEKKSMYPNVTHDEERFIANFYKYAFVGTVLDWVSKGMEKDPEIIVNYFYKIIHKDFIYALETFNNK